MRGQAGLLSGGICCWGQTAVRSGLCGHLGEAPGRTGPEGGGSPREGAAGRGQAWWSLGFTLKSIKSPWREVPGGPVAETALPKQGARVQSLVRELDFCMPQLKVLYAATQTWSSHIK